MNREQRWYNSELGDYVGKAAVIASIALLVSSIGGCINGCYQNSIEENRLIHTGELPITGYNTNNILEAKQ